MYIPAHTHTHFLPRPPPPLHPIRNTGIQETFGEARKFQAGKGAKKAAEAHRQVMEQLVVDPEEEARNQAILDEINAMRGPSLMDKHLEKKSKGKGAGGAGERQSFDWERDIMGHRSKVNMQQAKELVASAKNLDSRFSAASSRY